MAAFEAFFSEMPARPGMAFILVQHLSPDCKSLLSELVGRFTHIPVFEAKDGMLVHINCIYIIPPNCDLTLCNGALHLQQPIAQRSEHLPIDFFFHSLATSLHSKAIGIVLSGTACDGTIGLRAIKDEGGMIMAQLPASTEFNGMPNSAIGTGLVDYVLPPAEMPAQILAYTKHSFGQLPRQLAHTTLNTELSMSQIFMLLQTFSGHDFSDYKPSIIHRRIDRRIIEKQGGKIRIESAGVGYGATVYFTIENTINVSK